MSSVIVRITLSPVRFGKRRGGLNLMVSVNDGFRWVHSGRTESAALAASVFVMMFSCTLE
jgi:hypothetical protein